MNIRSYLSVALLSAASTVHAQNGCTDPEATNYNAGATVNDGSCIYPPSFQMTFGIGTLLPQANESSGLTLSEGFLWTHNDHGGKSEIYKVDTATGHIVQTLSVSNYPNTDWEDITTDDNYLYIGDFGNNDGNRTDLKVLRISKSQFISNTAASVSVTADAISFSYTDQTDFTTRSNHNFDCESVIAIKDSLYLFTKDRGDLQSRVYKLPKVPGTYSITPFTSYDVHGLITGADYDPQRKQIVLIGYQSSHLNSFLYYLNDFNSDQFFSGNKRRVEIGNATNDWQTEGIAFNVAGDLYLSCETSYVPATLYKTSKHAIVPLGVTTTEKMSVQLEVFPNPASDKINIKTTARLQLVEVFDTDGKKLLSQHENGTSCIVSCHAFSKSVATVFLRITTNKGTVFRQIAIERP